MLLYEKWSPGALYDREFSAKRLGNWQLPKYHQSRPQQRKKSTQVISNDRGHLLPGVTRPTTSPWGQFKGTWQLPDKISRHQAWEINEETGGAKWPKSNKKKPESIADDKNDQEYIPGNLTHPQDRHVDTQLITEHINRQKKIGKNPHLIPNDLYVEKHECSDPIALLAEEERKESEYIPHVLGDGFETLNMTREVTEKPGEKNTTPIVPAYCNFQMARKMAQENLEHQPLPDSIMDRAFRKLQAQGYINPELALDVMPIATGVGVKTYMAGPTHCTKLKVYRPKTCGILPKPLNKSRLDQRPHTSGGEKEKMGAMDLAICWDYRPLDPRDEPKRPTHIDGSNGSAAPAVFTLVKTPRPDSPNNKNTGRSGGVFSNTMGEGDFFDKDILRKQKLFGSRDDLPRMCTCGTSPEANWTNDDQRLYRSSRTAAAYSKEQNINGRRCKSSPNLSQVAQASNCSTINEFPKCSHNHNRKLLKVEQNNVHQHKCSRSRKQRNNRLCEQVIPQSVHPNRQKSEYKQAFKAGIPNSNSSGTCTSFDSGCASVLTSNSERTKVYRIPKPRNPYAKKNYDIDTLAPPFACWKGGAGQGGYPEHWRLASVYQHAYKPVEQRKRPLLATVYQ